MNLPRGTLVLVDHEPTQGLAVNDNQRFPLIAVVPVTGTHAQVLVSKARSRPQWPDQNLNRFGGSGSIH